MLLIESSDGKWKWTNPAGCKPVAAETGVIVQLAEQGRRPRVVVQVHLAPLVDDVERRERPRHRGMSLSTRDASDRNKPKRPPGDEFEQAADAGRRGSGVRLATCPDRASSDNGIRRSDRDTNPRQRHRHFCTSNIAVSFWIFVRDCCRTSLIQKPAGCGTARNRKTVTGRSSIRGKSGRRID